MLVSKDSSELWNWFIKLCQSMETLDGVSFILIFLLGCSKQCKINQNSNSDFAFTGLFNMH